MARYTNGTQAENYIDLNITVDDENDNAPVIQLQQFGYVNESSRSGMLRFVCVFFYLMDHKNNPVLN